MDDDDNFAIESSYATNIIVTCGLPLTFQQQYVMLHTNTANIVLKKKTGNCLHNNHGRAFIPTN